MKESRQEDYDLTEEVEQFINFLRKKYEMDKEKSSGGAVMKKYVSPCGMEMDEEIFAIMMERNPWFTLTAERLPIPCKDEEEMSYLEYRLYFRFVRLREGPGEGGIVLLSRDWRAQQEKARLSVCGE